MQQFSFDPAPFNQFNKYLINVYILYKGMSFTLRQIRINAEICLRVNDTFIFFKLKNL